MRLKIRDGIIYDDIGRIVGTINAMATEEHERIIELGSEAIPAIEGFVTEVNSGKFHPRTVVKRFETLLEKYKID